jgi:hypothetical protein
MSFNMQSGRRRDGGLACSGTPMHETSEQSSWTDAIASVPVSAAHDADVRRIARVHADFDRNLCF